MADLFKIEGVEIFAAGTWNGDKYTEKDLDSMVKAFEETSETVRPYLKLGHSSEQVILQNDGFPAAGWIGKLYRNGEKLLADFVDIPSKIFELLKNKAYRKVSSEIYHNIKLGDKNHRRLLSAVALLGSDMPAVSSLDDILALYGLNVDSSPVKVYTDNIESMKIYNYIDDNGGQKMPKQYTQEEMDAKVAETETVLTSEVTETKAELETKNTEIKAKDAEIEELKEFKASSEAKELELELAKETAENEQFIVENKVPESAREFALALMGAEKKEYSFGETNLSKREVLKKYTELIKETANVNLEEGSLEGETPETEEDSEKIKNYSSENKCSYSEAYRAVMATKEVELNEENDDDQGDD